MMNLNENRVREYAYFIWEAEGKPHGQDHKHWEMACKLAESETSSAPQQTADMKKDGADNTAKQAKSPRAGAATKTTPKTSAKTKSAKPDGARSNGIKADESSAEGISTQDDNLVTSQSVAEYPEGMRKPKVNKRSSRKSPSL